MGDYERIAQVIRHLDEHHAEQPDLAALAQRLRLSPFHFHRLFARWAAVTPKDFLQCLTVAHARRLLREGGNVLDAALSAGLSGPGRLHDLCVTLEAATPGELKSGGAGCDIRYGFAETPFGEWLAATSRRGVCHIAFTGAKGDALEDLRQHWPEARLTRDDAAAAKLSADLFADPVRGTSRPTLRAFVRGTPFQVRVWRALLQVPFGSLVSYGRLAEAAGSPAAARAVGSAVASNPIAVLIPCHRVIRETGVVGEYRWGQTRKRCLLAWESACGGAGS